MALDAPCVPVQDECYITKSEFCTMASACANGHQVWNTTGEWVCRLRPGLFR